HGRGDEVNGVVRRAYRSGVPIEVLADRVIAPAMAAVGHGWEADRIEVWQEHRGTQLLAAALYNLKGELEARAERNRPVAVGGAPLAEPIRSAVSYTTHGDSLNHLVAFARTLHPRPKPPRRGRPPRVE